MLRAGPAWVAVTKMDDARNLNTFQATIQCPRAVLKDFLVVAGHGGLVDLHDVAARCLQIAQLFVEGHRNVHGHGRLVVIALIERAVDHRHGSWHRHFDRLGRLRLGKAQIVDDGRLASLDLSDNTRHRALQRAAPIDRLDGFVCKVDAVEARQDVVDKPGAALLTVGQKIETDVLLDSHVETRGIVLRFFERVAFEQKIDSTAFCGGKPAWTGKAADGRCSDGRKLHYITSKDFSLPISAPGDKDKALITGCLPIDPVRSLGPHPRSFANRIMRCAGLGSLYWL